MKFTLSWLKEHLQTDATLEEITRTLTAIGLEVESVEDSAAALSAFTVAEILEASPHPDADKLKLCRVQSDEGELQIVCGAANAKTGLKVALAKVGAWIPNGEFKIKKSKIRGVESCGMLCSARELHLGEDHDGIMELPRTARIGQPIAEVLGLDDPLIEIAITPNRGDCLGVYGIARDLAAAGLGTLKPITIPQISSQTGCPIDVSLQTAACKQFIGIVIENVKNAVSPEWLQNRLKAVGLRPISALVDLTNYFTMAYGRPLHVYDADKLTGNIIVRSAEAGEAFDALNDKSYRLAGGECVIADEAGMLGLGGIVGGVPSSVSESTRRVLLECAWFEPEAIANTGRYHGIDSDARYRFERTVDPAFMEDGAKLAAQMILDLCGGEATLPVIAGTVEAYQPEIHVDTSRVNQLAGMPIAGDEQSAILERLGFTIKDASEHDYRAIPPSWRPDIKGVHDITEEVLRIYGYDRIPAISLPKYPAASPTPRTKRQQAIARLRRELAAAGLHECINWAFMEQRKAELFAELKEGLILQNPISSELDIMRPTLLAHLIEATAANLARNRERIALFEIGPVYDAPSPEGQHPVAATLRAGLSRPKQWHCASEQASWLESKADAFLMLEALGLDSRKCQLTRETPDYYHPGRSGAIKLGPKKTLGYFGELHPATLQSLDIKQPVMACELLLDQVPEAKAKPPAALESSNYQPSVRDFAFLADADLPAGELLKAVESADPSLIESARLFDIYEGKGLEPGQKSLAISVKLQPSDHTLTEQEIEAVSQKIIEKAEKTGATLRAA